MNNTHRRAAMLIALASTTLCAGGSALADDANQPAQPDANALIVHLHRLALDRAPTDAELTASRAMLQRSAGYETILIGLVDGEAYRKRERSDDEFIADVFRLTLGRKPTGEETKSFRQKLQGGTSRLVQAMTLMATAEYKATRTRRLAGTLEKLKQPRPKPRKPRKNNKSKQPKSSGKTEPPSKPTPKPKPKTKPKPTPKSEPTAKPEPKPAAVTARDIADARTRMHTAWGKLADLMTDPAISLRSKTLAKARQAYFDARDALDALLREQTRRKDAPK